LWPSAVQTTVFLLLGRSSLLFRRGKIEFIIKRANLSEKVY